MSERVSEIRAACWTFMRFNFMLRREDAEKKWGKFVTLDEIHLNLKALQ